MVVSDSQHVGNLKDLIITERLSDQAKAELP